MSDNQPQKGEFSDNQSSPSSVEDFAGNTMSQEVAQDLHHLMFEDKKALLTEYVRQTIKSYRQQNNIFGLEKSLKKAMIELEMVKQHLQNEQRCRADVQALTKERQELSRNLNAKQEIIDRLVKQVETVRAQFKNEVRTNRQKIEDLSKGVSVMGENASKQANEFQTLAERWNACKMELEKRIKHLTEEKSVLYASQIELATKIETLIKEQEMSTMTLSEELKIKQQKNERGKHEISEINETITKLEQAQDQATEEFKQTKLSGEQLLNNFREELQAKQAEKKKLLDEKAQACDEIRQLRENLTELKNRKHAALENLNKTEELNSHKGEELKKLLAMEENLKEQIKSKSKFPNIMKPGAQTKIPVPKPTSLSTNKNATRISQESDSMSIVSFHHDNRVRYIESSNSRFDTTTEMD
ncbi:golgin subfamily A member 6-like protein 4 [Anopheles ziemanni]|uniref:golgin subfamily A member 6-like protein 4 n=1 Tax=Anopheles coustani TaxID=139045 RepID=UPI002657E74A|nr:golgin subfamily A member 6-like protein 4 [Anopheles coustani]XP_058174899.1 golgin subfamily A member 6-like protein 4 [Anopheles ziemanni]